MKPRKLHAGQRVGYLKVIQYVTPSKTGSYNTRIKVRVECDCGRRLTIPEYYLVRHKPKTHCGCKTATFISTHWKERRCWHMMRVRCYDPNHVAYRHYGGRNIRVCDRWLNDPEGFVNFVADLGLRPSMKHTLDRFPNVDGHYEPGNVRWATPHQQAMNKRHNSQYLLEQQLKEEQSNATEEKEATL